MKGIWYIAGTVSPVVTRNAIHVQKPVAKTQPIPPIISNVRHTKKEIFLPILNSNRHTIYANIKKHNK